MAKKKTRRKKPSKRRAKKKTKPVKKKKKPEERFGDIEEARERRIEETNKELAHLKRLRDKRVERQQMRSMRYSR